ncbi:MAG: hypothetical protein H0X66_10905 [Verrucomicrobia bacterium]|nr:hypothetical protein [Verrucomicrobiota bacterium]
MKEDRLHSLLELLIRPFRMLTSQKCRLVTAHRPIKPMRRSPALCGCHLAKDRNLLWAGLSIIRQHNSNVISIL